MELGLKFRLKVFASLLLTSLTQKLDGTPGNTTNEGRMNSRNLTEQLNPSSSSSAGKASAYFLSVDTN